MRSGITRQALRRHRWSLLGPAVTQALGACEISMMIMTAMSFDSDHLTRSQQSAIKAADLSDATTVFLGDAIYLSIVIIGVTMSLAITRQLRDIALLRTIGAQPWQIRRSVALQAMTVAVPFAVLGCVASVPLGYGWMALLHTHDVVPDGVRFTPHLLAIPIAVGVELVVSVVAAYIASVRVARISPLAALTEVVSGRRGLGGVRGTLGVLLILAGVAGSATLSLLAPSQAGDAAVFVMFAECIGVGMIGPGVLRAVAGSLRHIAGARLSRVAVDNIAVLSRALSGALVPLVLAVSFATVIVAVHATAAAYGPPDAAADRWTDYSGTAMFFAFAAIAAVNALITVQVGRRRELATLRLAGASRRDVLVVMAVESAIVTVTALVLVAGVSAATLVPIVRASVGAWVPSLPPMAVAGGVLLTAGLVITGMVGPVAVLTRQPSTQVVEATA